MTAPEPTREMVKACERALGCRLSVWGALDCLRHHLGWHDVDGCPVSLAAARDKAAAVAEVEADRDALAEVVEKVRALAYEAQDLYAAGDGDGTVGFNAILALLPEPEPEDGPE